MNAHASFRHAVAASARLGLVPLARPGLFAPMGGGSISVANLTGTGGDMFLFLKAAPVEKKGQIA